jgi:hypothetical protein
MKPIFEGTGTPGMIKVWNSTNGYLDVSTEGHLLGGGTSAWVEETEEIIELLEQGLLIPLENYIPSVSSAEKTAKKKQNLAKEIIQSSLEIDNDPVVLDENLNNNALSDTSNIDVTVESN